MSKVKIEWESQGDDNEYNIYKSEKMIDFNDLSNPISTTENTFYVDNNVEHGKVYYYVIERVNKFDSEDRDHSSNKIVACLENTYVGNINSVMKIDAFGNEVWTKSINSRPVFMQADNSGNLFVVLNDHTLVKYDYTGEEVWNTSPLDEVVGMELNNSNVHLIGESTLISGSGKGLVSVDEFGIAGNYTEIPNGNPISITTCGGETIVLCDNGDINVFDESGSRLRTENRLLSSPNAQIRGSKDTLYISESTMFVKLDSTNFINADNTFGRQHSKLVVGPNENVYIIEDVPEFNIRKIKSDRLNGWGATINNASDIVVDSSGNVIIQRGTDGITKTNNAGQILWEKNILGTMVVCTEPSSFWI